MSDHLDVMRNFVQAMNQGSPHAIALKMETVSIDATGAVLRVPYDEKLIGDPETGVIAGGVVTKIELAFKAVQNEEFIKQNAFKSKRGQELAVSQGRYRDPEGKVGNFVTVWERQGNGEYRYVFDAGGDEPFEGFEQIGQIARQPFALLHRRTLARELPKLRAGESPTPH